MPVPTDRFDQGHRERPSRGAGGDHSWAGSCYAGGIEDLSPGAPGGDGLGMTVSLGQVERDIRVLGHCAGPGTSRRSPRLYSRLIPATPDVRRGPRRASKIRQRQILSPSQRLRETIGMLG